MSFSPGHRIGNYEIVSPKIAGGMGEVYHAKDLKLGRDVALKVLPTHFVSDADRVERLQREAKVLAGLNHPHIASVYAVEGTGNTYALIMEWIDGETLARHIEARGPLSFESARPIALQILSAIEAAHSQSIVHRDLKPSNVMITARGHVKLIDFGLAKRIDPSATGTPTLSEPFGTPAYMPPERLKGDPGDAAVDLWGFGCVLYEMLTCRKLFHGTDLFTAISTLEPDFDALLPDTPDALKELLRACVTKDSQLRLRSAARARELLECVPIDHMSHLGRHRTLILRIALIGVLVLLVVWVWQSQRGGNETIVALDPPILPSRGVVELDPETLAISEVLPDDRVTCELTIVNHAMCDVAARIAFGAETPIDLLLTSEQFGFFGDPLKMDGTIENDTANGSRSPLNRSFVREYEVKIPEGGRHEISVAGRIDGLVGREKGFVCPVQAVVTAQPSPCK